MVKIVTIDKNAKEVTLTLNLDEIRLLYCWMLVCHTLSKDYLCPEEVNQIFGREPVCSSLSETLDKILEELEKKKIVKLIKKRKPIEGYIS